MKSVQKETARPVHVDAPHNMSAWKNADVPLALVPPVGSRNFSILLLWGAASGGLLFCEIQWCEHRNQGCAFLVELAWASLRLHGEGGSKPPCREEGLVTLDVMGGVGGTLSLGCLGRAATFPFIRNTCRTFSTGERGSLSRYSVTRMAST